MNQPVAENSVVVSTTEHQGPQIGERTTTHVGGNITAHRQMGFAIAAKLEAADEKVRVNKSMKELITGEKVSPLSVTFRDICNDMGILGRMQPLGQEPDIDNGSILMWEGYEGDRRQSDPKWHLRTPLHRVIRRANGSFLFQRKSANNWRDEVMFKLPPFFRKGGQDEMGNNIQARVSQDGQRNTVVEHNRGYCGK